MHAKTWANQSPGESPKKGTKKEHKEDQTNRIEEAIRPSSSRQNIKRKIDRMHPKAMAH